MAAGGGTMTRTFQSLLAILLILGIGVPAWLLFLSGTAPPPAAPPRDLGPVPVEVRTLAAADLPRYVTVYGTLQPQRTLTLSSEVAGRLARYHPRWRTGARVTAGEELLALEPRPFELARDRARALLGEADAAVTAAGARLEARGRELAGAREKTELVARELSRLEQLLPEGIVSENTVDRAVLAAIDADAALVRAESARTAATQDELTAQARRATASAVQAEAEDRLARSRLLAPFDGRFAGRPPAVGGFVAPGTVLGELVDTEVLVLVAAVPEDEIDALRVGQEVTVQLVGRAEVASPAPMQARVTAVAPKVDGALRSVRVEVELQNDGEVPLAAGLFAEARVNLGTLPDSLVVLRRELRWRDGSPLAFVLVERDGERVCEARELTLERSYGEGFIVAAGLEAGDVLISAPIDPLRDGMPCRPRGEAGVATGSAGAESER